MKQEVMIDWTDTLNHNGKDCDIIHDRVKRYRIIVKQTHLRPQHHLSLHSHLSLLRIIRCGPNHDQSIWTNLNIRSSLIWSHLLLSCSNLYCSLCTWRILNSDSTYVTCDMCGVCKCSVLISSISYSLCLFPVSVFSFPPLDSSEGLCTISFKMSSFDSVSVPNLHDRTIPAGAGNGDGGEEEEDDKEE